MFQLMQLELYFEFEFLNKIYFNTVHCSPLMQRYNSANIGYRDTLNTLSSSLHQTHSKH